MSVLNPRNRLVNFRLSEAEFDALKGACHEKGARSISEFARTAVLHSLDEPVRPGGPDGGQVQELDRKVNELEVRVEQLLRLLTMATGGSCERSLSSSVVPRGGDLQRN